MKSFKLLVGHRKPKEFMNVMEIVETWFGKSLEKTDSSLIKKTIQKDGELAGMVIERLPPVHHHISKVRAYF